MGKNQISKNAIKKVAKVVMESGGKKPVSRAMREVGYSAASSRNPQKITKSKTWQKILEEDFPDAKIGKIHNKLLTARILGQRTFPLETDDEIIRAVMRAVNAKVLHIYEGKSEFGNDVKICYYSAMKDGVVDKALDKMYKLKGRYTEKVEFTGKFRNLSNEDLMELINETSKSLKKK